MQDVVNNISYIISSRGLKQGYIAEKAGFSEKMFSNILHGRKTFKVEYVMRICKALDISPNELFGIETKKGAREHDPRIKHHR